MSGRLPIGLLCGTTYIQDALNPTPDEIDLEGIEARHKIMHRFSSNPASLTVWQHKHLVVRIAEMAGASEAVVRWCLHHDDHEGITVDIPGPLKSLIASETSILSRVEAALDVAICHARGIDIPTEDDRAHTHTYDKIAETIEWAYVMNQPPASWNAAIPRWLSHGDAVELARWAKGLEPETNRLAVDISTMKLTDDREEYYVQIVCEGRSISTCKYGQDYYNRALYERDELRHVLLGGVKPDLMNAKYADKETMNAQEP